MNDVDEARETYAYIKANVFIFFSTVEKRVCEQVSTSNTLIPFDTLTPGLCFVTPYGIVEVINDDRAIPYYDFESPNEVDFTTNLRKQMKLYNNAVLKRQNRDQKQMVNVAILSLARRILLRQAYDDHRRMSRYVPVRSDDKKDSFVDAVRYAYLVCGDVPNRSSNEPIRKDLEDPSAPASSFPDRIVECKLLPDQRPRYIGDYDKDDPATIHNFRPLEGLAKAYSDSDRIFIQRRLLTTPYSIDSERYYCPVCYQCFTSKPGYKYHVEAESCVKKAQSKSQVTQQHLSMIESRAIQLVEQNSMVDVKSSVDVVTTHRVSDRQLRNVQENHTIQAAEAIETPELKADTNIADDTKLMHPDAILAQLESEMYRALGQTIGPIYPEVWKVLGYRKALPKSKKQAKRNDGIAPSPVVQKKNRNTTSIEQAVVVSPKAASTTAVALSSIPKPILPSPPIIDIRPLAQEIDAGRYPSMKRYVCEDADGRDAECAICKSVEPPLIITSNGPTDGVEKLLPCDFCRQAEHYVCAITKFTIKYPEPCDDFMCHNCIGVVATRRTRAERRRLEKLISINADSAALEAVVLQQPIVHQKKQQEIISLTNGIVRDREFECVAAQGRRLDELHILLRDAQTRLSLALDAEDINHHRLSLIDTLYSDNGNQI
jgi:hypothetical protein